MVLNDETFFKYFCWSLVDNLTSPRDLYPTIKKQRKKKNNIDEENVFCLRQWAGNEKLQVTKGGQICCTRMSSLSILLPSLKIKFAVSDWARHSDIKKWWLEEKDWIEKLSLTLTEKPSRKAIWNYNSSLEMQTKCIQIWCPSGERYTNFVTCPFL